MGQILYLHDVAKKIAARRNISKESAEHFLQAFFTLQKEALLRDKFVKITGFGTSKVLETEDQKSNEVCHANVLIPITLDRICFQPDGLFQELVNRPFDCFSTVALAETIDTEKLDEIETGSLIDVERGEGSDPPPQSKQIKVESAELSKEVKVENVEQITEKRERRVKEIDLLGEGLMTSSEAQATDGVLAEVEAQLEHTPHHRITKLRGKIRIDTNETIIGKSARWGYYIGFALWSLVLVIFSYWIGSRHILDIQTFDSQIPQEDSRKSHSMIESVNSHISVSDASRVPIEDEDVINNLAIPAETAARVADDKAVQVDRRHDSLAAKVKSEANKAVENAKKLHEVTQKETHTKVTEEKNNQKEIKNSDKKYQVQVAGNKSVTDKSLKTEVLSVKVKKAASQENLDRGKEQDKGNRLPHIYIVHKGENIYQIAAKLYGTRSFASKIIRHNGLANPDYIVEGQQLQLP